MVAGETVAGGAADGVAIARHGAVVTVTLDRPARLHAIDDRMRSVLAAALPGLARDINLYAMLIRASPARAFSAGGDLRELHDQLAADPALVAANLRREYTLIWELECFPKPTISLIDGAVMGSGVGLTLFGTHRVAGPGYSFRMPETAIGFFPDVGVAHAFARMPGEIGVFLGLTGRAIGRADALKLGLATHCIEPDQFDGIEAALAAADTVDPVLDGLHRDPGPAPLDAYAEVIQRCFGAPTVAQIVDRLHAERQQRDWCAAVAAELQGRSPLALEVTLRHIREAGDLDLRQTLVRDYRIACRLIAAPDFRAAVRATLIEKTGKPDWRPARLGDVTQAMVERILAPMPGTELVLATMAEAQALRD